MSGLSFKRNRPGLDKLLGIRARLVLLALILVAPLMLERARSLEDARNKQIAVAYSEFARLAKRSAENQREVISSVETLLKSAAHIQASKEGSDPHCDILQASLPVNPPWIRNLSIVGRDGRIKCSTVDTLVGLDLSDRGYLKRARQARDLIFSDFMLSTIDKAPMMIGAYPVSAVDPASESVIVTSLNLGWMSKIMSDLGDRPGILAVLVDSAGIVLAAPTDQAGMIGRPMSGLPALSPVATKMNRTGQGSGVFSFTTSDGSNGRASFSRLPGTGSRLVLIVDEARVAADINREIRNAYLQLALVCLFVLLGALAASEKLIIGPIDKLVAIARRFGKGDWSACASESRLPAEFAPLARAFDSMAAQLAERERELIASNDRLTVMASMDMLSGLANRRGFQSRLDFEWMKAQQALGELSLMMIDVDHFKLFNDTYGHPEGDACLARLGENMAGLAVATNGFAARYGGEEFSLLLPNTDAAKAFETAEIVRVAVRNLAIPHATSSHETVTVSIGVATTRPSVGMQPVDLIEAADASLYRAKRRGRNAVVQHALGQAGETGDSIALAS
jgi:diguanylate cyclase (GGDEF)-like protein